MSSSSPSPTKSKNELAESKRGSADSDDEENEEMKSFAFDPNCRLDQKLNHYSSVSPPAPDKQQKANRRMSQALTSHLVLPDDSRNFKLGDVVRARPPGETISFEGVAVSVDEETITIDFGDDAAPTVFNVSEVQRVQNGVVIEVDDIVQCKSMGVYCVGRVQTVNFDGTYNVAYDGTDDVDYNVEPKDVRKMGSGRSSTKQRFKKAVAAITAIRAFAGNKIFETWDEDKKSENKEEKGV